MFTTWGGTQQVRPTGRVQSRHGGSTLDRCSLFCPSFSSHTVSLLNAIPTVGLFLWEKIPYRVLSEGCIAAVGKANKGPMGSLTSQKEKEIEKVFPLTLLLDMYRDIYSRELQTSALEPHQWLELWFAVVTPQLATAVELPKWSEPKHPQESSFERS